MKQLLVNKNEQPIKLHVVMEDDKYIKAIQEDDLIDLIKKSDIETVRNITKNIEFTFYTDALQLLLLDYNDTEIDRSMLNSSLTFESCIELSQRNDKETSSRALEFIDYIIDDDMDLYLDSVPLYREIKKRYKFEGTITKVVRRNDIYTLLFKVRNTFKYYTIQAQYKDRVWKLSMD